MLIVPLQPGAYEYFQIVVDHSLKASGRHSILFLTVIELRSFFDHGSMLSSERNRLAD